MVGRAGSNRPLADRAEVAAPALAALGVRAALRLPKGARRRILEDAFERAAAAFNREDFEALFALFADDVRYYPPPALSTSEIVGRAAVLSFWKETAARYESSTITNLELIESGPGRFVRTARLVHRGAGGELSYVIVQTTELAHGRVALQRNEQAD